MRVMLALALLLAPFFATAQSVSAPHGHDDPRFQRALQTWLADDDANTLSVFAMLARNDNIAAQIMLGQIAQRPVSPWLRSMPAVARNALLLAPPDPVAAGASAGVSWLHVAAKSGDELAGLLLHLKAGRSTQSGHPPPPDETAIRRLAAHGEQGAANRLIHLLSGHKPTPDLARLGREGMLSPDAAYCGWLDGVKRGALTRPDRTQLNAAYLNNDPGAYFVASTLQGGDSPFWRAYRFFFRSGLPDFRNWAAHRAEMADVGRILANAPHDNRPLAVLRRFCRLTCADDYNRCLALGVGLAGGYEALRALGSPAETLVSHADFANSPRATADLIRHFRDLGATWPSGAAASARGAVACVARALREPR